MTMPSRTPARPHTPRKSADNKARLLTAFRRSEILTAATRVFGHKGFEATRMDDIAREAGLAKGTLYLYFRSKDAIYKATVQQALAELRELTHEHVTRESTFAGRFAAFIRVRIAFWNEQQSLYRVILSMGRTSHYRKQSIAWQREAVEYLATILAEATEAGDIPATDLRAAAWATMDAIRGFNERRIFSEGRSVEEDTRFLTAFLLAALRSPDAPRC